MHKLVSSYSITIKLSLIFCFSLCLLGCSRIALTVVNIPSYLADYSIVEDIEFSAQKKLLLDVYIPAENTNAEHKDFENKEKAPVLVFFYGGRWTSGDKADYRFVADRFVKKGYVVVVPNYRKYPSVKFPAFVEDGAEALAWVYKNIGSYEGDPKRIFVSGHSAGAHIGALLTVDERYLEQHNIPSSVIRGFAGLAGPYSFVPDEEDTMDMFGPEEKYSQMQATSFIGGREPPMLLLHGEEDTVVKMYNLQRLKKEIVRKNGRVATHVYPDMDHVDIVSSLSWVYAETVTVASDIDAFFKDIIEKMQTQTYLNNQE